MVWPDATGTRVAIQDETQQLGLLDVLDGNIYSLPIIGNCLDLMYRQCSILCMGYFTETN
jgi:hypothetical protein